MILGHFFFNLLGAFEPRPTSDTIRQQETLMMAAFFSKVVHKVVKICGKEPKWRGKGKARIHLFFSTGQHLLGRVNESGRLKFKIQLTHQILSQFLKYIDILEFLYKTDKSIDFRVAFEILQSSAF